MRVSFVRILSLVATVIPAASAFAQMDVEIPMEPYSSLALVKPVVKLDELLEARRLIVDGTEYLVQLERHIPFADEPIGSMNRPEYSIAVSRANGALFQATRADMNEASIVRAVYCDELGHVTNGSSYVSGRFEAGSGKDLPDWNFTDGCVFVGVVE